MQVIAIFHRCLLFKFNKKKFLFGLTHTLSEDLSTLAKIKTDYLILPSFPYLVQQSVFFWNFSALHHLNCTSIIISDTLTKKRIQSLMSSTSSLSPNNYKWEMLKQHELNEQQLIRIYQQLRQKNMQTPLFVQPNGLGYNDTPDKLNFIVSEQGRSIILMHESDTILVDPPECIEQTFNFFGIPFSSLRAIILTKPNNSNLFELIFKTSVVSVITTEFIYAQLKKFIKDYFNWDQEMIRKKLRGKILTQELKYSKYRGIDILYKQKNAESIEYLDLVFGLKRIRLYPLLIERYPSEIIQLKDLQLLFLSQIEESIKKQLESSPQAYRKKIVFNRVSRKYNNKYFYTIRSKDEVVTVQAHQYKQEQLKHVIQDFSFMFKHRDENYHLSFKELGDKQKFNANGRVVYVRQGYVRSEKGRLYGINTKITQANEIVGVKNATIMYQSVRNVYFNEGSKLVDPQHILAIEDLLKKIKDNSFIKSLKRTKQQSQIQQIGEEQVENGSEWEVLNRICSFKTFEAGFDLGNQHNIYFVVKGCMKYRNEQTLAMKSMGIGNIRKYYNSSFEDNDQIEVVKDSWTIEISLKELHDQFFTKFPAKMYELFTKPNIFS